VASIDSNGVFAKIINALDQLIINFVDGASLVKNGVAQIVTFLDTDCLPASLARNTLADASLSEELP